MVSYNDLDWTSESELEGHAADDQLWELYQDTGIRLGDLLTVMPLREDGATREQSPLPPLHVVTAIQPGEEAESVQRQRMQVLDDYLGTYSLRAIPAVGFALNGDHFEDSRAVFGLCDDEARELGRRFGQVAVFGWNGRTLSLIACVGERRLDRPWKLLSQPTIHSELSVSDRQVVRQGIGAAERILTVRDAPTGHTGTSWAFDNPEIFDSVRPALTNLESLPRHRVYINPDVAIAGHYLRSRRLGQTLTADEFAADVRLGGHRLTAMKTAEQVEWIQRSDPQLQQRVAALTAVTACEADDDAAMAAAITAARQAGAMERELDVALYLRCAERLEMPQSVVFFYKGNLFTVLMPLPTSDREAARQPALNALQMAGLDRIWLAENQQAVYPQGSANRPGTAEAALARTKLGRRWSFIGPRNRNNEVSIGEAEALARLDLLNSAVLAVKLGADVESVLKGLRKPMSSATLRIPGRTKTPQPDP